MSEGMVPGTGLSYVGPLCTENDRLGPGPRGGKWTLKEKYRNAKDSMIMTFRGQVARVTLPDPEGSVCVMCTARVPPQMDHHGVTKLLLDSLEGAGVYKNDRQVVDVSMTRSSHDWPVSGQGALSIRVYYQLENDSRPIYVVRYLYARPDEEAELDTLQGQAHAVR